MGENSGFRVEQYCQPQLTKQFFKIMATAINKLREAVVGVKVTPPQQHVLNNLYRGLKIIVVNQHRANGGEWYWINNDENTDSISYAGSIYKAFWNLNYQIKKQTGKEFPLADLFISKKNDVRYSDR